MKKNSSIIFFFIIILNNFIYSNLHSQINNSIVVKVGNSLITSLDVQNEIITNLVINKVEISQVSIDSNKQFSLQSLIKKKIKSDEVKRFQIKDFSAEALQNYIDSIAKNLDTDQNGLKEIFRQKGISYQAFVESYKNELLWNTLIFSIYRDQTNINIIEVESEIEDIKDNKSEEELKKIKEQITNRKKSQKLNLFSRSHFSNLENSILVEFQ